MEATINAIHKKNWVSFVLEFLASMGLIHDITSNLSISDQVGKIVFFTTSSLFVLYWLFYAFYKIVDKKVIFPLRGEIIILNGKIKSLEENFEKEKGQIKKTAIEEYENDLNSKKIFSFVKKAEHLIDILQKKELYKTLDGLFDKFSDIPSVFENFFLPQNACFIPQNEHLNGYKLWDGLNGITISNYFNELNRSRNSILLGNFRIYALCVSGITDLLMNADLNTRVVVWTVLKKPLWRWYNMINISNNYYSSPEWWEKYLSNVKTIKATKKFQMKRLVVDEKVSHKGQEYGIDDMFIYKEGLSFSQLKERAFPKADLIDYIADEQTPECDDCKVYPIAFKQIDTNWKKLKTQFEQDFGHFTNDNPLQHHNGVFNKIIDLDYEREEINGRKDDLTKWFEDFDDIFIVEFIEEPSHPPYGFGIAFRESKTSDDRGIVILDQTVMTDYINTLKKKW